MPPMGTLLSEAIQSWPLLTLFTQGPSPHLCQVLCTTEHGTSPKDMLCSSEHVIYDFVATVQNWAVVCSELTRSLNPIPGTKET